MNKFVSLSLILLLAISLFSFSVYASGNSTDDDNDDSGLDDNESGSDDDDSSDEVEVEIETENETEGYKYKEKLRIKCESESDREERIRCKIKSEIREHKEDVKSVPEACRNLKDSDKNMTNSSKFTLERCKKLFNEIRPCHEKEGKDKLVCFKRVSGLGTAAVSGEANKTDLRNYVVSLLDELQVRIENAAADDKITDEKAVEIVALIVEAKEKILSGASREEVKLILKELKLEIQGVKAEVNSNE